MKIIEYQVVSDTHVQEWIAKGWQPWGSPMMNANFPQQAMVKYEEETPAISSDVVRVWHDKRNGDRCVYEKIDGEWQLMGVKK